MRYLQRAKETSCKVTNRHEFSFVASPHNEHDDDDAQSDITLRLGRGESES